MTVTNCTFIDNVSASVGGAIYTGGAITLSVLENSYTGTATLNVINSTFIGNSAPFTAAPSTALAAR